MLTVTVPAKARRRGLRQHGVDTATVAEPAPALPAGGDALDGAGLQDRELFGRLRHFPLRDAELRALMVERLALTSDARPADESLDVALRGVAAFGGDGERSSRVRDFFAPGAGGELGEVGLRRGPCARAMSRCARSPARSRCASLSPAATRSPSRT